MTYRQPDLKRQDQEKKKQNKEKRQKKSKKGFFLYERKARSNIPAAQQRWQIKKEIDNKKKQNCLTPLMVQVSLRIRYVFHCDCEKQSQGARFYHEPDRKHTQGYLLTLNATKNCNQGRSKTASSQMYLKLHSCAELRD